MHAGRVIRIALALLACAVIVSAAGRKNNGTVGGANKGKGVAPAVGRRNTRRTQ